MHKIWNSFVGGALWDIARWVIGGITVAPVALGIWEGVSLPWLALLVLAAAVLFLWGLVAINRLAKDKSRSRVEFFQTREHLRKAWSLTDQLKSAESDVWALWHSGPHAYNDQIWKHRKISRLLLPHPEKAPLDFVVMETGEDVEVLKQDIRRVTSEFLKFEFEVRWYVGLTASTFMIGDPDEGGKWVHLETIIRDYPNWPSFRAERQDCPDLIRNVRRAYNSIWNDEQTARLRLDNSGRILESYS